MRMEIFGLSLLAVGVGLLAACSAQEPLHASAKQAAPPQDAQTLVVGGGCFWCIEPLFEMVKGVSDVESGYAGGYIRNPSYEQVSMGTTGHAEVIKITFDPKVVSAEDLLRIFFTIHDPTTKDRQGPDSGPQYRSVVFFSNDEEKARAEKIITEINEADVWKNKIVTTLEPLKNYATAEDYHQDYYKKYESANAVQRMNMNAGYCRVVIEPKVIKFKKRFEHLMKDG